MPVLNGVKQTPTAGSDYGDPWETRDGTEAFSDDFTEFSGWSVYTNFDTTSSPSYDTTASVFRAKGANPCIDATAREHGLIVMPENNTSGRITIARDISGVLDGDQDWTIMARWSVPTQRDFIDNTTNALMGYSLPGNNLANYNSTWVWAIEQGTNVNQIGTQKNDNGVGTTIAWASDDKPNFHNGIWTFMYHKNAVDEVYGFFSLDGGRTLSEIGTMSKDTSSFTTLFFSLLGVNQMEAYSQIEICYTRVYQSLKQR